MSRRVSVFLAVLILGCGLLISTAPASSWYWKPGWPSAPSGVPDFDQNQDFDNADGDNNTATGVDPNYCTPVATANSIWWYGSIPGNTVYQGSPTNLRYPALADVDQDGIIDRTGATSKDTPVHLVQSLAVNMDTNDQRLADDGHQGTWIPQEALPTRYGGHTGTDEYIMLRNVPLKTRTYFYPTFEQIQSEVLSSHDVVLHVWTDPTNSHPETPEPETADQGTTLHSVTVAGVDCGDPPGHQGARIAISDPNADAREAGTAPHGRVLPPGHAHGVPYSALHNNPLYVSHDGYNVVAPNGGPGSGFGLQNFLGQDAVYATVVSPTADRPISFSVDKGAEGVMPLLPWGSPPNDVRELGTAGTISPIPPNPSHQLQTEAEVFQASLRPVQPGATGPNVDVISAALGVGPGPHNPPPPLLVPAPPGQFGLNPGDNINALSYGKDSGNVLYFSVDPRATGVLGTGVNNEAVQSTSQMGPWPAVNPIPMNPGGGDWVLGSPVGGNEAAGDVFKAGAFRMFGAYVGQHLEDGAVDLCWVCDHPNRPANVCFVDEAQLGLQAPANNGSFLNDQVEDDLDALEYADTHDGTWGVDMDGDGQVDNGKFAFFSLNAPSGPAGADSPEDILVSAGATPNSFSVYADGINTIGLQAGDDLDALILSDLALKQMPEGQIIAWMPDGVLNPGLDEALFSLAAGSPSLGAAFSPGDVFYTDFQGSFSLWVSAAQLGLLATDELNALDTMPHPLDDGPPIPEPGTLVLVLLSGVGLLRRRAVRRR